MKVELSGKIDERGQLLLVEPLPQPLNESKQVRVTIEYLDDHQGTEEPYDTPLEEVQAGLKRALQQADAGETMSLEQMWEEFEKD